MRGVAVAPGRTRLRSEEGVKERVEPREIVVLVHEQRAERRAHILATFQANPFDGLNGVEQPPVMYLEPGVTQDAPKLQQVRKQHRRYAWTARSSARDSMLRARSPRTS